MTENLDLTHADPVADLRATLDVFRLEDLLRLRRNLKHLVRSAYRDDRGRGCLLYFLSGGAITSKQELLAWPFPDEASRLAARRLVRHFDGHALSNREVRDVLRDAITRRKEVNALEDAALRRTGKVMAAER
jgi:hypothetical protein